MTPYILLLLHCITLSSPYHFFTFYQSAHHPYLHSFPTRRSSDLSASTARRAARSVAGSTARSSRFPTSARSIAGSSPQERSEEHTSELQSQSNLVCRLLLEKKKKTKLSIHIKEN